MATTQLRALKVDENNIEKGRMLQTKKIGTNVVETKRAALGELGNRAIPKKNETQKEVVKESKYLVNLKNTKPRVDSHWKKAQLVTTRLTRTNSIKTVAPKINTTANANNKTTTIAVKAVNNEKVSNVKAQKAKIEEKITAMRREDSNLSRKSLSQLKAVLNRGKKEKAESAGKTNDENAKVCETKKPETEKITVEPTEPTVLSHSAKLLNEAENIDADDSINPVLVSEYVNDIYSYLYCLEIDFPIKEDHLKNQTQVTPKMRAVLMDWINEVHYQFHLVPETFHMTVGIIDRYLQEVPNTARQQLQLVGVTALFIAAKYEELYPPEIADFVYITDDTYSKFEVLNMETNIMKTLDFQLGRPLSIHFLRRYSKAGNAIDSHHLLSKYFLELAAIEYSLAHYKPSEIAAASLYLAMQVLQRKTVTEVNDSLWTVTLEYYSRYPVEHLKPLVKKIALLVLGAPTSKLKAVYNKYQSSKFEKIALRSELKGPVIESICAD